MRAAGMARYHTRGEEYPEDVRRMIGQAFYGGRSQVLQVGAFDQAYAYDIHSAYPAAISLTLASSIGDWEEVSLDDDLHDAGLYRVTWSTSTDSPLTPFPHRGVGGHISYPHAGEGVYWGIEVRAAIDVFPRGTIIVLDAWRFRPANAECWAWYTELANTRVMLKASGDKDLERVAKLALNSVYGKTAQTKPGPGRWTSLLWAGLITAFCRARMLELASQNPHAVIFTATDGLMTTEPLVVSDAFALGDWGRGGEGPLFVVQSGVYKFGDHAKTRGFRGGDWDEMRRQWLLEGQVEYEHTSSRFVTLQEGLDRGCPELMAEWEEGTTVYRTPISASPGTYNARVPADPILDEPSRSCEPQATPLDRIPKGHEYRWKAAMILLGRPAARALLREQGFDAVLTAAKAAEIGGS